MKKLFAFMFLALIIVSCGTSDKKLFDKHDNELLAQSFASGDFLSAITAVQSLISRDTVNVQLFDTLSLLFQNVNNPRGVLYASSKIVKLSPKNLKAWENYAITAKQLNLFQDAINAFSQLYSLKPELRYLYEIGVIYYQTNNATNGKQIFDQILNNPKSKEDKIVLFYANNQVVQVPVLAAVYNFIGYQQAQAGNIDEAKKYYSQALQISPDFVLAKNNISELEKGKTPSNEKKPVKGKK
jgi:tetratricopeptide (TPR) repeat protein